MRTRWFLALFLLLSPWLSAKADIQYFPERKVWVLQAGETTYAFGVNERGELQSILLGPAGPARCGFSCRASSARGGLV